MNLAEILNGRERQENLLGRQQLQIRVLKGLRKHQHRLEPWGVEELAEEMITEFTE